MRRDPRFVTAFRYVSTHDHVGHMHYGDGVCSCSACGQRWQLVDGLGYVPEHYSSKAHSTVRVVVAVGVRP